MKILVACEESQAVTIELRRLGHEAYSCDIQPCSGGHPEWHLQVDALELLKMRWDMIIAFPPCTYLSKAGSSRLRIAGQIQQERMQKAVAAKEFFMAFYNVDCPKVAIENPIPGKIHGLPHYSQIIQPYMFGDPWMKTTCLWLKGLPILMATDIVTPAGKWVNAGEHGNKACQDSWKIKGKRSAKKRAKTFPGIARAMAEQWAGRNKEVPK